MNAPLNEKESLRIIQDMIAQAKKTHLAASAQNNLFWGCYIALLCVVNFILLKTLARPDDAFYLWFAVIPGVIISYLWFGKKSQREKAKNHLEGIISALWVSFSISVGVLFITLAICGRTNFQLWAMTTSLVIILLGMAIFGTGAVTKQRAYYAGAVSLWIAAIACAALPAIDKSWVVYQPLVMAAAMIPGFIIPNYLILKKR